MARKTKMPPEEELPDGPRREFVAELRLYYRAAGYPPLREVSQAVERHQDPRLAKVTASAETVRRMITGKTLPVDLERVSAVFHVLCEMPDGIAPDGQHWDDYGNKVTNWESLRNQWGAAMEDDDDAPPLPQSVPPRPAPRPRPASEDPWSGEHGFRTLGSAG